MTGRIFDVVAYITRRYGSDRKALADPVALRDELLDVGFEEDDVERALGWLARLRREGGVPSTWMAEPPRTQRIPTPDEARKLSAEARGFVQRLEQAGIVDVEAREAVYERAVGLDLPEVGLDEIRVLVALVLVASPATDEGLVARILTDDLTTAYH